MKEEKVLNILHFRPPRIALFYLLLATGLHFLSPGNTILYFPYEFIGTVGLVVGFILMIWSWGLMKKRNTAICPTENPTFIVNNGPFQVSRNPMYLGMILILLGIAFFVGIIPLFLVPVAFFITMNNVFIPYEEKKLESIFQQRYLDYKSQVRRWL